ncbi:MAG: hypothetical protein JXQ90_03835 [Cyclobacteriaceae bacterium]
MKNHWKYLFMLIAIVPMPFSCQDYPDPGVCPDTRYDLLAFDEMQLNGEQLAISDTTYVDALRLEFIFSVEKPETAESFNKANQFSFFNAAFALSCIGPHVSETIQIINITSNQAFSSEYPAGSDLKSLFNSTYGSTGLSGLFIEVRGFYDTDDTELAGYSSIELAVKPEEDVAHVFTVKFRVGENDPHTVTTNAIAFNS